MKVSPKGISLIKEFEGRLLHAYHDIAGVLTIGYGHTGPDVHIGQIITEEDAEALLVKDLERFERCVSAAITVPASPIVTGKQTPLEFLDKRNAFR